VEKTTANPYRSRSESYGKQWDDREYPHPYTAEEDGIAAIHQGRLKESITFKRCGTCGETVEDDLVGLIIYNNSSQIARDKSDGRVLHSESGPYHLKCLALNFTMCPHLANTKIYAPAVGLWKDVRQDIMDAIPY